MGAKQNKYIKSEKGKKAIKKAKKTVKKEHVNNIEEEIFAKLSDPDFRAKIMKSME